MILVILFKKRGERLILIWFQYYFYFSNTISNMRGKINFNFISILFYFILVILFQIWGERFMIIWFQFYFISVILGISNMRGNIKHNLISILFYFGNTISNMRGKIHYNLISILFYFSNQYYFKYEGIDSF